MTQTEINQVVEAMQLTPKYKNILRKCLNGDNEGIKNAIKKLNDADIELNTKLSELANKVNNLKTDVFAVVNSLPTENIENKIYCVKDTTDGGTNNKFIEYIYIETTKSWEKVGEFKAEPDLSGYAKLTDIGAPENFTFTLEDGSTVTKSIRVISTTSQAGA